MTDAEKRIRETLAQNADMADDDDTSIVGVGVFTYGDLRALLDEVTRLRAANVYLADEMRQMRSALGDF